MNVCRSSSVGKVGEQKKMQGGRTTGEKTATRPDVVLGHV